MRRLAPTYALMPHWFFLCLHATTSLYSNLQSKRKMMLEYSHDKLISLLHNTSVWTIASGTVGGVYKTIAQPTILLNTVTIDGSISVATYAFLSAAIGYCTKKGLDFLFQKFKKK